MNTHLGLRLTRPAQCGMLLLVVLTPLAPPPLRGQAVTGSLPARVLDADDAVVPDATVKVRNLETGVERTATTNDEGIATFAGLPPGKYQIEVEASGFRKMTVEGVEVGVSRSEALPLRLEMGAIGEPVTIPAADLEDFEDPLEVLPNINNDLTPLLQVVPGAAAASPAALGRVVIDGRGEEQQTLRLDGLDVTPLTELPSGDPLVGVLGFHHPCAGAVREPQARTTPRARQLHRRPRTVTRPLMSSSRIDAPPFLRG